MFEAEFDPIRAMKGKRNVWGYGPYWFVNEWGKAAVHAVRNGWGVIIFKRWGGAASPWCRLEWIFCTQCLQIKYPGSVFVLDYKHRVQGSVFGAVSGRARSSARCGARAA